MHFATPVPSVAALQVSARRGSQADPALRDVVHEPPDLQQLHTHRPHLGRPHRAAVPAQTPREALHPPGGCGRGREGDTSEVPAAVAMAIHRARFVRGTQCAMHTFVRAHSRGHTALHTALHSLCFLSHCRRWWPSHRPTPPLCFEGRGTGRPGSAPTEGSRPLRSPQRWAGRQTRGPSPHHLRRSWQAVACGEGKSTERHGREERWTRLGACFDAFGLWAWGACMHHRSRGLRRPWETTNIQFVTCIIIIIVFVISFSFLS